MKEFMMSIISNTKEDVTTNCGWYYFLLFVFVFTLIDIFYWVFI